MDTHTLIGKYDVPGPRYTSYPTVPYWDAETFSVPGWEEALDRGYGESNATEGIGLYVHLPYCESLCTFCGCTKRITRNHSVEAPYVDRVLREWEYYRGRWEAAPRVSALHLGGGTPTFFSPEQLVRLVEGLLDGARFEPGADVAFEAHPNFTSAGHLQALHGLGFTRLSLGVQDFDPEVQAIINRVQPFERVREVTEAARGVGFESINFDLVYGLPLQRPQSVADTVDKVLALRPDRIAFYGYAHVPWIRGIGQRRYSEADLPSGAEKRRLYELGRTRLEAAGYREIGMDHFALETDSLFRAMDGGTLHRNFQGYTERHSLVTVGLGMSAISDSWYGFAQNHKTVEAWAEAVDAGASPVFRGHLLDPEDRGLRRHILELMCRFHTERSDDASGPAFDQALERLAPLAGDGLVCIRDGEVAVTDAGRPFVRNVCMAFDARLWRNQPTTQIFSRTV